MLELWSSHADLEWSTARLRIYAAAAAVVASDTQSEVYKHRYSIMWNGLADFWWCAKSFIDIPSHIFEIVMQTETGYKTRAPTKA